MTRKRFDSAPHINVKDEGMLIQQVAGSTTNLLEVKAHDGATLMAVDYAGTMTSGASNTFTYLAATTSASLPANTTIGAVSSTELGYLDGVTSAIQNQLNSKLSTAVTSAVAGTGISVSAATGAVTFANTGVTGLTGTGDQISVSSSTGGVTISLPSTVSFPGRVNIASEKLWFGAQTRQMVNLWSSNDSAPQYGIGVQSNTQYFRTGANFAWYSGGSHNDAELNAGGGTRCAYLSAGGLVVEGTIRINKNSSGFYQNSTSAWSGNPGGGQGKIEYHSNRWYIASGSDSTEILRIRRDGSDVVVINNDGRVNAPHWTTSGRNYCQEWIQFDNHTGVYSPLNNAHFYPNNGSYGAWRIDGTRNTWRGLEFDAPGGNLSLMMDTVNGWGNQHVGVHNNSYGWIYLCIGKGMRTNSFLPIDGNNTGMVGNVNGAGAFNAVHSYSYPSLSDFRMKHDIQPISESLNFINSLNPVKYKYVYENYISDETDEHGVELLTIANEPTSTSNGNRYRYGFIAQEVKAALEMNGSTPGESTIWGLADKDNPESQQHLEYLQFIGPLVAAVQELSAKVAVLEAERGV